MAINHQVRNQQLEILINDLKLHMGVKTSVSNDTARPVNVDFSKLLAVENFLTHVMMNKRDIFCNGKLTELGQKYEKLGIRHEDRSPQRSSLGICSSDIFSIYINLFFACMIEELQKLRRDNLAQSENRRKMDRDFDLGVFRSQGFSLEKDLTGAHKNALNEAIKKFRGSIQSKESKLLINSTRQKAAKRFKAAEEHLDELLEKHGVLTCIALDLTFIDTIETNQSNHSTTEEFLKELFREISRNNPEQSRRLQTVVQKMQEYFTKLIRNGKNHQALRDLVGYFQKWEFSSARGIYSRTIFIFPQSAVKDLDTLIESIGNYWNDNITDGKGLVERARLSKMPKQLFSTACTIKANDKDMVENFKQRVLFYLTHIDLYYQPVELKHFNNLFSRSEKKKTKPKPGEQPLYS